jgi:EAL domain-containing protein (putative c-di-GMP-specific phosphodiesterase class I)
MTETPQRRHAAAGEVVFREGDEADCAFVIESGAVTITASRGGTRVTLATLRAGEPLGEMALLDAAVRSATATAIEPTSLIVIGRDQVQRKLAAADPLIRLFLGVVLRRLRRTSRLVGELADGVAAPGDADGEDTGLFRLRRQAIDQVERENELAAGLAGGEFVVYYQPMVSLASGCAAGFEALLRWRRPDGALRKPDAFIALAEGAGAMGRLTLQVLAGATAALPRLQAAVAAACPAARPAYVSFNLSASDLGDPRAVDAFVAALAAAPVDPGHLQVEVTESVLMESPERAAQGLLRLKERGVSVAVDDFGTGYSSLAYLHQLPLDVLKIDRSFVGGLRAAAGSRTIVRAVARLAADMGLATVAEGVETPEQLELVRELGCDLAQGYLFAPPRPFAETVAAGGRYLPPGAAGARG